MPKTHSLYPKEYRQQILELAHTGQRERQHLACDPSVLYEVDLGSLVSEAMLCITAGGAYSLSLRLAVHQYFGAIDSCPCFL